MSYPKIMIWCSELCLYLAIPGFYLYCFGAGNSNFTSIALLLAIEILCFFLRSKPLILRIVPLFLSLLILLPAMSFASLIFLIPPIVLISMRSIGCNWGFDRDIYRKLLPSSIFFYLITALYSVSTVGYAEMIRMTFPLFLAWLLFVVLGLRLSRMADNEHQAPILDLLLLLGAAFLCFLLSRPLVLQILLKGFTTLNRYILGPLVIVLVIILFAIPYAIFYLIQRLIDLLVGQQTAEPIGELISSAEEELTVFSSVTPAWLRYGVITLALLLFIYVMVLVLRQFTNRDQKSIRGHNGIQRERITNQELKEAASRKRSVLARQKENSIRASFRRYLKLCKQHGTDVSGTIASDMICRQSSQYLDYDKALQLRDLWLKSRYSSNTANAEEVRKASHLVSEISKTAKSVK